MVDGKAQMLREDYCDGLGNCLPACLVGAISFEKREVTKNKESDMKHTGNKEETLPCGCPGTNSKTLNKKAAPAAEVKTEAAAPSELSQWPVQIKLVPANAPYFEEADLLIAADCAAYSYAAFHKDFIKGRITLLGCPKLDGTDYSEKLSEIIKNNDIKSVTVARMEVPCCGGLEEMVKQALIKSGKMIPWTVKIITVEGDIK